MENRLVHWVGVGLDGTVQKLIKMKLEQAYSITDRDMTTTEQGFKFVLDDETHGDIEIQFEAVATNLKISIYGDHAWEVGTMYDLVDSLFCHDVEAV
ncbi:hypothetical protein P4V64_26670 [Bacillus thuringiensis]|nr:hypothetical protein [Bacillus thuringiensis]